MTPTPTPTDQPITPKEAEATSEQVVSMLLEAGQRSLGQAILAIERNDYLAKFQAVGEVSVIIEELVLGLNHEEGGELASNLLWVYDWWTLELHHASARRQPERLASISRQMSELQESWERYQRSKTTPVSHLPSPGILAGSARRMSQAALSN